MEKTEKITLVKAENVRFTYDENPGEDSPFAVDGVSFEIKEGDFVAVLGRNGSGKSTLAKLLCMIYPPDEGTLIIDGVNVSDDDTTEEEIYGARRDVGMVFQNPDNQIVATIVEDDVAFGPENLGMEPGEIRKRVDAALAAVGMSEYARHSVSRLSGGQKQRVAIAGAIAMKRKCIVFDESTAMLDPSGRRDVMNNIIRLNREEGVTVIMITHYMNEASMADRIYVMDRGRFILEGTPEKVFSEPELLWNAGLDVPQSTELLYKLRNAGTDVPVKALPPEDCASVIAGALGGLIKDDRQ